VSERLRQAAERLFILTMARAASSSIARTIIGQKRLRFADDQPYR